MHDLIFHRKSGFLLGISLLITAVIGGFLFFPIISLYLPYDHTHVGILVPSIGRKGYVLPTYDVSVSGNGELVAYTSNANSLRYGNGGSNKGLFLYNQQTGETQQVSTGLWHPAVSIENAKISESGEFIAFFAVTDYKIRDTRPTVALYLYDLSTQTTKEVPLPEGIGLARTNDVKFSQDGRFLWVKAFRYEELSKSSPEEMLKDIRATLPNNSSYGKLLALSTDQNTAVVSIASNVENLGDFDLTSNLYQLDRQTGEFTRIPTPNWKRSAFLILTVMNTIVAGYILLTD